MLPLISIVIPVYNVEAYLTDCLESVINQTYKNLEIIIVNDKSTDNSAIIMAKFAKRDSRIRVINQKENAGYGKAINTGFKVARGEFIGIVESDDFIAHNMYEILYMGSLKTSAEIIKSNFYHYKSSKGSPNTLLNSSSQELDKKLVPNRPLAKLFAKNTNFLELDAASKVILLNHSAAIWSAIYRSDFIKSKALSVVEIKGASYQDYQFLCETTFEANKIYLIADKLYFYRVDNLNSSLHSKARQFVLFDLFYKTYDALKKRNIKKLTNFQQSFFYGFILQFYWGFYKISNNKRLLFLDEWEKALTFMLNQDFDYSWLSASKQKDIKSILSNTYIAYFRLYRQYVFTPIAYKISFKHIPEIIYFIIFRMLKRVYKFLKQ